MGGITLTLSYVVTQAESLLRPIQYRIQTAHHTPTAAVFLLIVKLVL